MAPSVAPVLVAGGGPTGLVAALALLQNNVPVRIVDKEPQYHIGQRGNGVWPRSFDAYHFLRVHEMHQKATPVLLVTEYKLGTIVPARTFALVAYKDATPSIPYNNGMVLGQQVVEEVLRSHLEKYGCTVELGTELESFHDDGERVLAKLVKRNGDEEAHETFEASYIIGADGAKGVTRKQLGLTFHGETRQDLASVFGDICLQIKGLDRKVWHFFGKRTDDFLSLRPTDEVGPDGYQFLLTMKGYDPRQFIADEEFMFQCMAKLVGSELDIRKVVGVSRCRPNIRMVDKFGHGRVYVAGDSAHIQNPAGGQGLNNGVQDALNLVWKLSLVYKGLAPSTLLESYNTERLPVITEMQNITTEMLDSFRRGVPEDPIEREMWLNMLGVHYRSSPIVVDEFTTPAPSSPYRILDESELVAGDRPPDAPSLLVVSNGTETRLFDVYGVAHHTVLVFTPDTTTTTDVLGVLGRYPRDVIKSVIILPQGSSGAALEQAEVVIDQGGDAYRAYLTAKGERKVVVVRPDGVVGAIVHGAEGVQAYLSKIFA